MLGLGVIIALMIVSNAVVLIQLNGVSSSAKTTLTTDVQAIDAAKRLQSVLKDQERDAGKFIITHDPIYFGMFTEGTRKFASDIDTLLMSRPVREELDLILAIGQDHAWFAQAVDREARTAFGPAPGLSDELKGAIQDTLGRMHARLERMISLNQLAVGEAMARVEKTTGESLGAATMMTLGSLALAILLAFFISRTITRPIDGLISGTERISHGAFDPIRVSSNDEIALLAEAINAMSYRLKQINEVKAEMMQQISHELRSPLSTILGAHYLLTNKRGSMTDDQFRLLEIIRESVDRLTNFSHQFLDVAKIEAGMMEYRFESADILPLVEKAVRESEISAARKNIRIGLTAVPSPPVSIDAEKMSIVIGNLLSNAVKYTGKNGEIRVAVAPSDEHVRITVSDTGIGIPSADLPHVFKKFFKGENASQSGSKGTGVGLALAKAYCDGHGAALSVESEVGAGSTFTIEVPLASTNGKIGRPAGVASTSGGT